MKKQDEADKSGSFIVDGQEWMGKIWPRSNKYRIVKYGRKIGLQAEVKNSWLDVIAYDNGYDDYGKLYPGQWKRLSDICGWDIESIRSLKNKILGIQETVEVLE